MTPDEVMHELDMFKDQVQSDLHSLREANRQLAHELYLTRQDLSALDGRVTRLDGQAP